MSVNEDLLSVYAWVESLHQAGVMDVCISPGSRSTPLTTSIVRKGEMRVWSILDERAAGFFALGLAKASSRPVAVVCTSGTASANYFPAIMEAHNSQVPLVIITADRPPELREIGSNQTVDQLKLYGTHVKWFYEMPVPNDGDENQSSQHARQMALRAVTIAGNMPAGPVHINYPFREPLMPPANPGQRTGTEPGAWSAKLHPDPDGLACVQGLLRAAKRPLVVCGGLDRLEDAESVRSFSAYFGIPVLADVLSQLRTWGGDDDATVINTYPITLQSSILLDDLRPDLIFRFGATPTNKPLLVALATWSSAPQVVVSALPVGPDAVGTATHFLQAEVLLFCRRMMASAARVMACEGWTERWAALDDQAECAMMEELERDEEMQVEGRVFHELMQALPDNAALFIGNSMPIRHAETYLFGSAQSIRIFANRGASGIDGIISSAFGVAAGHPGPVTLVIGDVSFYHDLPGLLHAARLGLSLRIILINNDGGGIFTFLSQASHPDVIEHFTTPHGLQFQKGVEMFGGRWYAPKTWMEFRDGLRHSQDRSGLCVFELNFDKEKSRTAHQALVDHTLRNLSLDGSGKKANPQ